MTSTETPPSLLIPPVKISVEYYTGENCEDVVCETENAVEAFSFLEKVAEKGADVFAVTIDGRAIDADSLAALNAYLRTPRALNWNGVLPFNRICPLRNRWNWHLFLAYLDVTFAPLAE